MKKNKTWWHNVWEGISLMVIFVPTSVGSFFWVLDALDHRTKAVALVGGMPITDIAFPILIFSFCLLFAMFGSWQFFATIVQRIFKKRTHYNDFWEMFKNN